MPVAMLCAVLQNGPRPSVGTERVAQQGRKAASSRKEMLSHGHVKLVNRDGVIQTAMVIPNVLSIVRTCQREWLNWLLGNTVLTTKKTVMSLTKHRMLGHAVFVPLAYAERIQRVLQSARAQIGFRQS
mmetsp:Transcript_36988/g.68512  ORF Transcript_36988/g.68512 Transcript_36988/m.68512 type:complete len:128 (+) Transcript_36988:742-1125(+)